MSYREGVFMPGMCSPKRRQGHRVRISRKVSAIMEALDPRRHFDVNVEFEQVTLPTTGNTPVQGAPVQIQVDMKNIGTSAFKQAFTVGVQLLEYAIGTTQDRLILPYGD